jgi:hypothetical protein
MMMMICSGYCFDFTWRAGAMLFFLFFVGLSRLIFSLEGEASVMWLGPREKAWHHVRREG